MIDAGSIRVELLLRNARVARARVESTRPMLIHAFRGMSIEVVAKALRSLYALCGHAHAAAFHAACAAHGAETSSFLDSEVRREALREHAIHLLREWPAELGEPVRSDALLRFVRILSMAEPTGRIDQELEGLLGMEPHAWLAMADPESFAAWTRVDALLPRLVSHCIEETVKDAAACSEPGAGHAHGALRRMAGWPLLESAGRACPAIALRLLGRCGEWVSVLMQIKVAPGKLENNRSIRSAASGLGPLGTVSASAAAKGGHARVETARGGLEYVVELDGERVGVLAVSAPTDRHFADTGPVMEEISVLAGTLDEVRAQARRILLSFDPCVPFEVECRHA